MQQGCQSRAERAKRSAQFAESLAGALAPPSQSISTRLPVFIRVLLFEACAYIFRASDRSRRGKNGWAENAPKGPKTVPYLLAVYAQAFHEVTQQNLCVLLFPHTIGIERGVPLLPCVYV